MSKAGPRPSGLRRPFGKFGEQDRQDFIRITLVAILILANPRQAQFMLKLQHRRQQFILTLEVIIERPLCDA